MENPDDSPTTEYPLHRSDGNPCAVPSDPNARCSIDELLSIFGGQDRLCAERDLLRRLSATNGSGEAQPLVEVEQKAAHAASLSLGTNAGA